MAKYLDLDGLLYFFKQKVIPLVNKKIDIDQGKLNKGKVLTVGEDGNVTPKVIDIKTSYTELTDKPKINNVELSGNKTLADLGIQEEGDYALKSEVTPKADKTYVDEQLKGKQPTGDYALKSEVTPKADKTYVDEQLDLKVDSGTYSTDKTDIEKQIGAKADTTYVDGQLSGKQPTGDYALKSEVTPKADKTYVDEQLSGKQPAGDYALKGDIPTDNKDLTNGAGYQNASQVNSAITGKGYQTASEVQAKINDAVKGITSFEYLKVDALPETGKKGIIYLVPNSSTADKNIYDEYIWVDTAFEFLGTTQVDLTGYYNDKNLTPLSNGDIDTIVA